MQRLKKGKRMNGVNYDVYCVKADGKPIVFRELSDWTIVKTHEGYTRNYACIVEVRRYNASSVPVVPGAKRGVVILRPAIKK